MSDRNAETRAAFERLAQSAYDCLRTYERVTGRVPASPAVDQREHQPGCETNWAVCRCFGPAEVHDERCEADMVIPGGWTPCRCAERGAAGEADWRAVDG